MPRKQKRRARKRSIAPLPQAQLTSAVGTPTRDPEISVASPGQVVQESVVKPPRTARPSVEAVSAPTFVGPELRRIAALTTIVIVLLVVLSIVLR